MKKVFILLCICCLSFVLFAQGRIPSERMESLSGNKGRMEDFIAKQGLSLIALTLGETQENGQEQLEALVRTHRELVSKYPAMRDVKILHINVIAGAPFFVHGFISRGLAKEYPAEINLDDVFVVFLRNANSIIDSFRINADSYGTWIAVNAQGTVRWTLKERSQNTAEQLWQKFQ